MALPVHADYYSVLQVNRNATQEEIRAAYKQRATALHPDKNLDAETTKDFQRLVEAYSVLKDPRQRKLYDTRGKYDEDDYYSDDEEYEEDDEGVYCSCPFHHHHHGGASFSSMFEELFARHYSQYGYGGFFDDDDDLDDRPRNFWRKFGKGNSRFAADWNSFPNFPSTTELKTLEIPDRPSKPKVTLTGTRIKIEWAKRTPRKRVDKWHLSYSIDNGAWIELAFGGDDKVYEFTGVVAGTSYSFKVAASNATGMSEWSEATPIVVPGGAPKKVEEKVVPVQKPKAKKKPKKKADPDSKRSKIITELEDAISERDKARLEKAVTAAKRELESAATQDDSDELASFLHQAQAELRSINRETERQVLIQKLKAAGKSGSEEQFVSLEEKLRDLLKKDADDEDICAFVESEIAAARELLDAQLEKQRERTAATEELQEAMEAEDIDRLSAAIEEAARLSVPTKEARKKLKALQAVMQTETGDGESGTEEPAEVPQPKPAAKPAAPAAAAAAVTAKGRAQSSEGDQDEELRLAMELSRKEYEEEKARKKKTPLELQKQYDEKNSTEGTKEKRKQKGTAAATATAPAATTMPAVPAATEAPRNDPHSNPPCKNLWIGNLSWKVTEEHIRQTFSPFGHIESVKILAGKHCCFVNYQNVDQAMKARAAMFGELLLDRPLHIYFGRDDSRPGAAPTPAPAKSAAKPPAARVGIPRPAPPAVTVAAPVSTTKPKTAAAAVAVGLPVAPVAATPAPAVGAPVAVPAVTVPTATKSKPGAQPLPAPAGSAPPSTLAASQPPVVRIQSVSTESDVIVTPARGPAQRQPPISAPIAKPSQAIAPPQSKLFSPLPLESGTAFEYGFPSYAMPHVQSYVPAQPAPGAARSAQATLNSYAVSHVPPLVAAPAYFMMPSPMAYPWAAAPQIDDNDEEQKQPEEEDILMQRFGGWN